VTVRYAANSHSVHTTRSPTRCGSSRCCQQHRGCLHCSDGQRSCDHRSCTRPGRKRRGRSRHRRKPSRLQSTEPQQSRRPHMPHTSTHCSCTTAAARATRSRQDSPRLIATAAPLHAARLAPAARAAAGSNVAASTAQRQEMQLQSTRLYTAQLKALWPQSSQTQAQQVAVAEGPNSVAAHATHQHTP
jgi:hypothetical protein